ncbi:aldo/keto reductase [Alloscardovia criceti]|uniref:aldo/keto reductase n=1 Tax=Alloscardovia criceti TaxID=356828 RepID=UPI00036260E3|nr:aldo/keto reductase [Alloscardovia criceti]
MEYIKLNNGVEIPQLGYGVFQTPPDETERCVREAFEVGYRHIDTAQAYNNEEGVGAAIAGAGIDRQELFVTTKMWIYKEGYKAAKAAIDESLKKLQSEYIDLMLIHQPFGDYYASYRAMEEAYKDGKIRAIGVSNFYPDRLLDIAHFADVVPAVNQVETHVFFQQQEARATMDELGVVQESWGPFAEGRRDFFTNPTLTRVGEQYGKSAAQVGLRYLMQRGVVVIPKSTHRNRMEDNFNIFDFELSPVDMEQILALDEHKSLFLDHSDPQSVKGFLNRAR